MKVPFVDFGKQYKQHEKEYDRAIKKCLTSGKLILQKDVEDFEKNLAKFLGFKYVVAVANGTDALMIAMKALGLKDNMVTTHGYTFKATIEAIEHAGASADIFDIDEDVDVPVHIEGKVSYSKEAILEDACQAIGAKGVGYSGTACYSFYPAKILGCFGDGGAIATNIKRVADKARLYRHHWQTGKNEEFAYNSRLDNVQASFLNVKLKYLPQILKRREEIANKYKELENIVTLPEYQKGRVWQDYVIRVKNPDKLASFLKKNGIQTLGNGMVPPHIAMNFGVKLPKVEKYYKEMLRLPCNETLTDKQIDYVIKKVKEFYK